MGVAREEAVVVVSVRVIARLEHFEVAAVHGLAVSMNDLADGLAVPQFPHFRFQGRQPAFQRFRHEFPLLVNLLGLRRRFGISPAWCLVAEGLRPPSHSPFPGHPPPPQNAGNLPEGRQQVVAQAGVLRLVRLR